MSPAPREASERPRETREQEDRPELIQGGERLFSPPQTPLSTALYAAGSFIVAEVTKHSVSQWGPYDLELKPILYKRRHHVNGTWDYYAIIWLGIYKYQVPSIIFRQGHHI